jgi:pyrroloquinoline quinone biosynthesis protein B
VRIRVLGSAAGGGFPQWNCGCENCHGLRTGRLRATARTQESVAVGSGTGAWLLVNASPDVRAQLDAFPPLHPRDRRDSPIAAVLLTSAELDHCLGLFSLREAQPLAVYATAAVRDGLVRDNALYAALEPHLRWRPLGLGVETPVVDRAGRATGFAVEARPVPGKAPRWLEGRVAPSVEHVVALRICDLETGAILAYCPGAARVDDAVQAALEGATCVFFDGTFWTSDELRAAGGGDRRAEDMAHAPLGGPDGSLARLDGLGARRRVLVHLNNTNPLLREDAPERRQAAARGWEVAYDGMEIAL